MSKLRDRIEKWFESLAAFVIRFRWPVIAGVVLFVLALGSGLPKLKLDTSTEGFLHQNDPHLLRYNTFKDQFGRDDMAIVAIDAGDVFTFENLNRIKALHDDLAANVPHLNDITSLVNARNTEGKEDRLEVDDLLRHWPETDQELAEVKKRAMSNPLYTNLLLSENGSFTTIVLELDAYSSQGAGKRKGEEDALAGFGDDQGADTEALSGFDEGEGKAGPKPKPTLLTDKEARAAVETMEKILAKHRGDDFKLYLAGIPVVTNSTMRAMMRDMGLFTRLAVIIVGGCLFFMFRRISGVVYPLVTVGLALISTLGLMGHLGVALKTPTMILPSFILAVGVGASVHILALFYQALQRTGDASQALIESLGHSGLAVVMTSLTTAVGLASFATAEVAPIADLGVFATTGVMLALVFTLLLLPALLAATTIKPRKNGSNTGHPAVFDKILDWVTDFTTARAKAITVVSLALIILGLAGAFKLHFSHDVLHWLPKDMPAYLATLKIDEAMKGTVSFEVVVDTKKENGLYDPTVLKALDRLKYEAEAIKDGPLFIGKATSVADMLKEINQALNENRPEFYAVPDDAALIPQEFLLFENSGSDDLENFVDSSFSKARFTIKGPFLDILLYVPLLKKVESMFRNSLGGRAEITLTGLGALLTRTLAAAMHSAAKSYLIAFVVITIMMILLIGRLKIGLLAMLPNLGPILMTMGIMGWFNLPFDMFTMLIGSIAIGLAVDDTIHFMHNFRRYHGQTGNVKESIRMTLHTSGRAMLVTSVVLALGFLIFTQADMRNVYYFGMLTGVTVMLALLAVFFMAPALLTLAHPSKKDFD